MSNEKTVLLMRSKLQVYKAGYLRAVAKEDLDAAQKWKDGCASIEEEIVRLEDE